MLLTLRAAVLVGLATPLCAQSPCFDWKDGFANEGIDAPDFFTGIFALYVCDDGSGHGSRLLAGGHFSSIGGVPASDFAAWNGTTWAEVGGGVHGLPGYLPFMGGVPDEITALRMHDDGSGSALYVGGGYMAAGGQSATGLARWNGSTWTVIPGVEALVYDMASFDDGGGPALFVTGYLYDVQQGTLNNILFWRNNAWHAFSAPPDEAYSLCVFDDGSGPALYAAGAMNLTFGVWRWSGSQWSAVGSAFDSYAMSLCVHDDGSGAKLYVGGQFAHIGGQPISRIARWDGTSWSAVGAGLGNGAVQSLASFSEGFGAAPKLIAAGTFTNSGGTPASRIASWDGAGWSPLGSGLVGANQGAQIPLAAFDDGLGSGRDLYVGGQLTSAGGHPISSFAKWEGCGGVGTPFCPGDGELATACPCANFGVAGRGCASSQSATGALLAASGLPGNDTLALAASGMPANALCIFLQGDEQLPSGVVFGDGLRCVAGQLLRLAAKGATNGSASFPAPGDPTIRARCTALGAPLASHSARYYQVRYRDPDPNFCPAPQGNTWNVSGALRIVW